MKKNRRKKKKTVICIFSILSGIILILGIIYIITLKGEDSNGESVLVNNNIYSENISANNKTNIENVSDKEEAGEENIFNFYNGI